MIMECKCPHCGGENFEMEIDREENTDELTMIRQWNCHCACGETFIISDVQQVTSRLVAKDLDDLERLIFEEHLGCSTDELFCVKKTKEE